MTRIGRFQYYGYQERQFILLGNGHNQHTICRTELPDRTTNQLTFKH